MRSTKGMSQVERAFRSYKTVDLKVRPVHHRLEGRAHVFLCMLAYSVEWPMRRSLAPLLIDDEKQIRDTDASPVGVGPTLEGGAGQGSAQAHEGGWASAQFPHAPD